MSAVLEAALGYSGRGWPVLPLHWPRGGRCSCGDRDCGDRAAKHPYSPLVRHGLTDATTDPDVIRRWWALAPAANLGIATGRGCDVLDLDGPDACDALDAAGWAAGDESSILGPMVRTGRGVHVYCHPVPGARGAAAAILGAGSCVDWRGPGGYVVAPPSVHISGRVYAWTGLDLSTPLALAPSWLAAAARGDAACSTPRVKVPSPGRRRNSSAYAARALDAELGRLLSTAEGGRNDALNRAAHALGQLVAARELDAAEVADRLLIAAARIGLGEREAEATIRSGLHAGARKPRARRAS